MCVWWWCCGRTFEEAAPYWLHKTFVFVKLFARWIATIFSLPPVWYVSIIIVHTQPVSVIYVPFFFLSAIHPPNMRDSIWGYDQAKYTMCPQYSRLYRPPAPWFSSTIFARLFSQSNLFQMLIIYSYLYARRGLFVFFNWKMYKYKNRYTLLLLLYFLCSYISRLCASSPFSYTFLYNH